MGALCLALLLAACREHAPAMWDPRSIEPSIPEVVAALRRGEAQVALQAIDARLLAGTAPEGCDHYRGLALADLGRSAEALAAFERELVVHPGNGRAHGMAADMLLELGRLDEARAHIEAGRLLATDFPYMVLVAGRVALQSADDALAQDAYSTYLQADRTSAQAAEAHYALSQIAARAGDPARAAEHARTSEYLERVNQYRNHYLQRLADDPADTEAALGLAMIQLDLFREVQPDPHYLALAEEALQEVLAAQPAHATALLDLGFVRSAQGRQEEALALYMQAAAADPGHAGARRNAGLAAAALGRPEEALVWFEQALSVASAPAERGRILYDLARGLEQAGRPAEALSRYRELVATAPGEARDAAERIAALGG